jgi:hypothetical protein
MDSNQRQHPEKTPIDRRDTRSLIAMICTVVVTDIGIVGAMYLGNHEGMHSMLMPQSQGC